jgi:hypothetical protein
MVKLELQNAEQNTYEVKNTYDPKDGFVNPKYVAFISILSFNHETFITLIK